MVVMGDWTDAIAASFVGLAGVVAVPDRHLIIVVWTVSSVVGTLVPWSSHYVELYKTGLVAQRVKLPRLLRDGSVQ